MADALSTLIKIEQTNLDEKKGELEELRNLLQKQHDLQKSLQDSIIIQGEYVKNHQDTYFTYEEFYQATNYKIELTKHEINVINEKIEEKLAKIHEIFTTIKSYELIQQKRQQEAEEKEKKQEQKNMDEISNNQFNKRKNEEE